MNSWTYALITPDGLVTGSLPWIVDKLRASGLEPVVGRLLRLDTATMLRMYHTIGRSLPASLPPQRAFELWYGLGPGCVLLLHHEQPNAVAALLALKGPTLPHHASPDTIRYAGENGLMNLVHCPDDEACAEEELALLLGPNSAQDARRLAMRPNERVRRLTVGSLDEALPVSSGGQALSLPLVVNRIRLRLVQQLAIDGSADDSVLSALIGTASGLRDERREIVGMPTSSGRIAVAQARHGQLHDHLIRIARHTRNSAIETSLLGLCALLVGSQVGWPEFTAALEASRTYVSDAESAVLELTTYL